MFLEGCSHLKVHDDASCEGDAEEDGRSNFEHLDSAMMVDVADETQCEEDAGRRNWHQHNPEQYKTILLQLCLIFSQ